MPRQSMSDSGCLQTEARDLQELAEKIRRPGGYVDDPVSNRKLLDEVTPEARQELLVLLVC